MVSPLVAIVGAPNVGKSTLFNRLVGWRKAIVTDEPGVTRDRLYGEVRDAARPFRLVDTGGLTPSTAAPLAGEIERQALAAMDEAILVLFVVDGRAGATATDYEVAAMLRRSTTPVVLVASKAESTAVADGLSELYSLGLGDPVPVSAEHAQGIGDLLDRIEPFVGATGPESPESDSGDGPLSVAIVGRPNVGKSTLFNRLVGEERVVVSDVPGTTRDAVDTMLAWDGRTYRLIDTAGLRRRGRAQGAVERFSVVRARANIDRCDVAVLLLDAADGFAAQDAHVAGYVIEAYKPLVAAVNKWDLVEDREREAKRWEDRIQTRLRFAKNLPMLLISAATGQRATRVLDKAAELHACAGLRVRTTELNDWLQRTLGAGRETPSNRRAPRLFYAVQTGTHPPTFTIFCNDPDRVHFSYRRRLANGIRDRFGFDAAPIRLRFRSRREGRKP